ncbi:hypothetical protein SAMN05421690_10212 [Nitrosomonas sp. Nm51]|uniref:hypothetical protein n=1 Tax=Nitrosomonas sp. Nm51 TaxID=133720 RepID=UPI0008B09C44|nr:hypothetical protein [Nitrosomonas sp. Nm51]SER35379.1 hypothetical protein SAMN05421690_10212 [Nitrosomonas sp. Nm51]
MNPLDTLIEIIERVGASSVAEVQISEDDLNEWPNEAISALKKQKLLIKAKPASSAVCVDTGLNLTTHYG